MRNEEAILGIQQRRREERTSLKIALVPMRPSNRDVWVSGRGNPAGAEGMDRLALRSFFGVLRDERRHFPNAFEHVSSAQKPFDRSPRAFLGFGGPFQGQINLPDIRAFQRKMPGVRSSPTNTAS